MTVVHNDAHTYEQFLKISVGLDLGLIFVWLYICILFFWLSLDYFVCLLLLHYV